MFGWMNREKYSIDGKVVIVTGALGAIGKGLVSRLVQKGARVMLVDMQPTDIGAKYAKEIQGKSQAEYVQVDLRTDKGIRQMLDQTVAKFGQIDVLVNNAGLASPQGLYDSNETFDNISDILAVNLRAPIEATRLFVKHIQQRDIKKGQEGAVIVNVASMAGLVPSKGAEIYGAAKAGLLHLTKSSASLAPMVRVCAVAPYFVRSPMVLDNPKHKNNNTIVPALMLSIDQVCRAVERCIEDLGSAGKVHAMMGSVAFRRVWLFELAWIQVMALAVWALFISPFKRLFGRSA
ncbi:hypothetical protein EV175_001937 [Coemansia sp. RSA 1933]|nr:hypothetical protein EV175_001937 [Coemansia sp. RSA 1933]